MSAKSKSDILKRYLSASTSDANGEPPRLLLYWWRYVEPPRCPID